MSEQIDKKTAELMAKRILKIEAINARDKRYTEKDMNEKIRKIIEEEILASEGEEE